MTARLPYRYLDWSLYLVAAIVLWPLMRSLGRIVLDFWEH